MNYCCRDWEKKGREQHVLCYNIHTVYRYITFYLIEFLLLKDSAKLGVCSLLCQPCILIYRATRSFVCLSPLARGDLPEQVAD
jgi:hypothetical protein